MKQSLKLSIAAGLISAALFSSQSNAVELNPSYFSSTDIYRGAGVVLYGVGEVTGKNGFRIPAIASAGNGVLISAADVRYMGTGWSDIVAGTTVHKTKISTKVSFDGGHTWSALNIIDAAAAESPDDYKTLASDPALVYDPNSGNALMFALRNNVNLSTGASATNPGKDPDNTVTNIPSWHTPGFIMFTSKDKGQTWTTRDIYDDVIDQVNRNNSNKKYSIVFQGPGGGMVYNNKIYVPIQAWSTSIDNGTANTSKSFVSTSGFMVSEDGGATWKVSKMLIPDVSAKLAGSDKTMKSSESNIFHYKGKIRLAVRNEEGANNPASNKGVKLRLVYEYDEATDSWTEVHEDFIPKNVAKVETSSHNLSEDVYLVGYTSYAHYLYDHNWDRRRGQYITTNTGIKLLLSNAVSEGYTSITSDEDNIYVMYEGRISHHDIFFKAIDWKHKDYAAINTQILRRARNVNLFQEKFAAYDGLASGGYYSNGGNIEVVGSHNGFKGGVFVKHDKDLDEGFYDARSYKNTDVALLLGYEYGFGEKDKQNVFFGYMNSKLDYDNGADNEVHSILAGYQLNYDFDTFRFRSAINAVLSDNKHERNGSEGLNKSADFNSFSFSLTNELAKGFEFNDLGNIELSAGMTNVFFSHEAFRESGGEGIGEGGQHGANNVHMSKASNSSHELFVKAAYESKDISIGNNSTLRLFADAKYAYDLANADNWNNTFRSMSVERKYRDVGELYSARDGGYFKANAGVNVTVYDSFKVGISGSADSIGEFAGGFNASYSF